MNITDVVGILVGLALIGLNIATAYYWYNKGYIKGFRDHMEIE